jgi:hypothetical protein
MSKFRFSFLAAWQIETVRTAPFSLVANAAITLHAPILAPVSWIFALLGFSATSRARVIDRRSQGLLRSHLDRVLPFSLYTFLLAAGVAICPRFDSACNPRTLFQEHDPHVSTHLGCTQIKQGVGQAINSVVARERSKLAVMERFRLGMLPLLIWRNSPIGIGVLVRDVLLRDKQRGPKRLGVRCRAMNT